MKRFTFFNNNEPIARCEVRDDSVADFEKMMKDLLFSHRAYKKEFIQYAVDEYDWSDRYQEPKSNEQ